MSENTFGIIFRNVRFGDGRTGTVFLTVLAHQSFKVQDRLRMGKPLLSAIFKKVKRKKLLHETHKEMYDVPLESLTKLL